MATVFRSKKRPSSIHRIAYQCKSLEFWEAGLHHLKYIETPTDADKEIEAGRVDLRQIWLSYTDRIDLVNTMSAIFKLDWSGASDCMEASRDMVTAADSESVTAYGVLEKDQDSYPYVIDESIAQDIIDNAIAEQADPRLCIEFVGGYYLTDLERTDIIGFSFEMAGILDTDTLFRIMEMQRRADGCIQIKAIQAGVMAPPPPPPSTTWNPSDKHALVTLSNGDLTASCAVADQSSVRAVQGNSSGKYYFEVTVDCSPGSSSYIVVGVAKSTFDLAQQPGWAADSYGYHVGLTSGYCNDNNTGAESTDLGKASNGDIIQVAVDLDAGKIWFGRNNSWADGGDPANGTDPLYADLSGEYYPCIGIRAASPGGTANFGATAYAYSPPSGFGNWVET